MILKYGMKIQIPASPISVIIPAMGLAMSSSSNQEIHTFTVNKYWEDDSDANKYKVRLFPEDPLRFGKESRYSSDLISSIEKGHTKVIN